MPIQQKEAYASMWVNLSPSKQESIIKAAINKIDEFNLQCFTEIEIVQEDSGNYKQITSLSSLERMFKLLLSLNGIRVTDKNEFKKTCLNQILEVKKAIGNSNFIWSSIACNIKDAFTLEHFFMNLMTQQLDLLYFKTFVINEIKVESVDKKKKSKKKKSKKKKINESGCCEKHPEFTTDSDPNTKFCEELELVELKRDSALKESVVHEESQQIIMSVVVVSNVDQPALVDNKEICETAQPLAENDDSNINKNVMEVRACINNSFNDKIDLENQKRHSQLRDQNGDEDLSIPSTRKEGELDLDSRIEELIGESYTKEASKPSQFCNTEAIDQKRTENGCSKINENKSDINAAKVYNMHTNADLHLSFSNEPRYPYDIENQYVPLNSIPYDSDNRIEDNQLASPVFVKDHDPIQRAETNDEIHSNSHDMTISTKAESKRKRAMRENNSAEFINGLDENKVEKSDSEFDEKLDHEIIELKPKKHNSNDDYCKNRSTEYNKNVQYPNIKALPSKLGNSNLILNDLNKIDAKPKKPKLKKINKDSKKPLKDKEAVLYVEKNSKTLKAKPVEKSKTQNAEPKVVTKPVAQPVKPETNASIKVISYWHDEPVVNEPKDTKKGQKDTSNMPQLAKIDSDNQSVNTKKGDKNRLKLKKKGQGLDKPVQPRRNQEVNASFGRDNETEYRKTISRIDKPKLFEPASNTTEQIPRQLTELNALEISKTKFNKTINEKIDDVIFDLEAYTHKLDFGRKIIQERISTIVDRTFNSDTVYVQEYGSYATKLLTPYSDMDLSIQGCLMLDREQAVEMLQVLCDNLKLFGFVKSATSILTALVPVIKIEADPSLEFENSSTAPETMSIKVDIIVDLIDSFNPISTALRTTDYIKYCISNYPSFYKNVLFLKFAMNCNDFTNTYKGGLNAYGLCILYVAYIEFYQLEKSLDNFELLRGFIKFISTQFSPETQAVYFGTAFR